MVTGAATDVIGRERSRTRLRVPSGDVGPIVVMTFILLVTTFNVEIRERLYLNHLAQLGLILIAAWVWWTSKPKVPKFSRTTLVIAGGMVAYLFFEALRSVTAPEFPNVLFKLLFVIFTLVALLVLDPTGRFRRRYLAAFVFGALGLCSLAIINSDPVELARGVRFSIGSLGIYGFNTLGFVLAIAITFGVYLSGESENRRTAILWLVASIVLLAFLIMTNSRGPAVSLAAAITVYLAQLVTANRGRTLVLASSLVAATYALSLSMPALLTSYAAVRTGPSLSVSPAPRTPGATTSGVVPTRAPTSVPRTAVPATAPYLERFDVTRDPTLSGRTVLWTKLLLDLSKRSDAMLVGFGLGTIDWQVGDVHYRSAHNTYLEILYFTGAIGLATFILLIAGLARKIVTLTNGHRRLAWAVFAVLLVSMVVDSYWGASQLGWLQSVLVYIVISASPKHVVV